VAGFEVFTAVTMKNAVLLYVVPFGFVINRRFGGTCHLNHQGKRRIFLARVISFALKMEATRTSEKSVHNKSTRPHIP
jgi:hypothetical protein